MLSKTMTW